MDPAREQDGRSQPDGRGAVIDCTAEANHPNNNGHSTPAATGLALTLTDGLAHNGVSQGLLLLLAVLDAAAAADAKHNRGRARKAGR